MHVLYMTLYQLLLKQEAIKDLTDNLRVNKVSDDVLKVSACPYSCRVKDNNTVYILYICVHASEYN